MHRRQPVLERPDAPLAAERALEPRGRGDAEPERAVDADRVVDPEPAQQRVGVVVGHVEVGEVGPHLKRVDARVAQRRARLGERERGAAPARSARTRPAARSFSRWRTSGVDDADRHRAPREPAGAGARGGHAQGGAQHSPQDRLHERGGRAAPTKRASAMTPLRASAARLARSWLASSPAAAAVAQAPVEWYTDTGGGGVLAQPPAQRQRRRRRRRQRPQRGPSTAVPTGRSAPSRRRSPGRPGRARARRARPTAPSPRPATAPQPASVAGGAAGHRRRGPGPADGGAGRLAAAHRARARRRWPAPGSACCSPARRCVRAAPGRAR